MKFFPKMALTVGILLLIPLVLYQLLLGAGQSLNEILFVFSLLISPYAFAPFSLGVVVLSGLHHSDLPTKKKLFSSIATIAMLVLIRVAMLFVLGDGSWGSAAIIIFGAVELVCYAIIGIFFKIASSIDIRKRDRIRLYLFLLLLGIFALQSAGLFRPGFIE